MKNPDDYTPETETETDEPSGNQDTLPIAQEMAKKTLTGDLRDILLDIVKHDKKTWSEKTEAEQQATIDKIVYAVGGGVEKAVKIMAADGRKAIVARLDQITVKDGIKAVLKISQADEQRHDLIDSTGLAVLIIVADPEEFNGEKAPAKPDPDQNSLLKENEDIDLANETEAAEGQDEDDSEEGDEEEDDTATA